jgi:hypothetical protein
MHICLLEAIRSSLGSLEWNMGSPKKGAEGGILETNRAERGARDESEEFL